MCITTGTLVLIRLRKKADLTEMKIKGTNSKIERFMQMKISFDLMPYSYTDAQ